MALTPDQEERIAAAVTAAEQRTAAEFAVVVAQTSDDYAGYPLIWAGAVAIATAPLSPNGVSLRPARLNAIVERTAPGQSE